MSEYQYYTDQEDLVWRYREGADLGEVSCQNGEWIPAFTPRELWSIVEGTEISEENLPWWVIR